MTWRKMKPWNNLRKRKSSKISNNTFVWVTSEPESGSSNMFKTLFFKKKKNTLTDGIRLW